MKPRPATQEDADFWSDEHITFEIGPMLGRHLGAEDIPAILKGKAHDGTTVIKVPWETDDRDGDISVDHPNGLTVWTTFWGGMPPSDVVIV